MAKRIIYWINNFFLHYSIATKLQEKCDIESYAIIDVSNKLKKFFEEQNKVAFKQSWYYHDQIKKIDEEPDIEYLENFEKK